tara:strand:- start:4092 stop:4463 length:372 start_codon:yes stop_codon:yes gene_type:complete
MNNLISHHLLLCATPTKPLCHKSNIGISSWNKLKKVIKELNLEDPNRKEGIVLRSKVDCLRVCQEGPILLIWPEGIWYGGITPERIELIIKKHVIEGSPLKDWIIKISPISKFKCNDISINLT